MNNSESTHNFFSNATWLALGQFGKIIIQFFGLYVLSRLLKPGDYGLMAMATIVTNLGGLLRDMGTGPAVIRAKNLTLEKLNTIFWLNIASATFVCILIVLSASFTANLFENSTLEFVLVCLAFTFPIMGFGAIHQSILERNSKFRILAKIEVVSCFFGTFVAVIAAYCDLSVFSLVFQAWVYSICSSLLLFNASKWRSRFVFKFAIIKSIFGFSGALTLSNFVSFILKNADSLIVGKVLGATILGVYSMAFKLVLFPLQNLSQIAQKALYPVLANNQENLEKIQNDYLQSLRGVALVVSPVVGFVMAVANLLVNVFLGSEWGVVAVVLFWLAPVGLIQAILSTAPAVFMTRGRTDYLLIVNIASVLIHLAIWGGVVELGIENFVQGYLIASLLIFFPYMFLTVKIIDLNYRKIIPVLGKPIIFGVCIFLTIATIRYYMQAGKYNDYIALGVCGICFFLFSAFFVYLFDKDIVKKISLRLIK